MLSPQMRRTQYLGAQVILWDACTGQGLHPPLGTWLYWLMASHITTVQLTQFTFIAHDCYCSVHMAKGSVPLRTNTNAQGKDSTGPIAHDGKSLMA
jgi:hypothetical protein